MHTPCFFVEIEKSVKVLQSHFVVDFSKNFCEDGQRNAKLGNVIFICKCYVVKRYAYLIVKNLNLGSLGSLETFSNHFFKIT